MRSLTCALAATTFMAVPALAQTTLLIDDFTMGTVDESTRSSGSGDQLDADNALGGARHTTWDVVSNPLLTRFNLQIAFQGVPGLAASMGTSNATNLGLTYGGSGASPNFLPLSLDLVGDGYNAVELDFGSVDLEMRVAIELIDYDGGYLAGRAMTTVVVPASAGQTLTVDFASFSTVGGFDFSDVDAVQFVFNSTDLPDRDFFLNELRFVPSPGAVALLGLGGLAAVRRRR
ncbi:MAG: hypothetical protein R3B49_12075 [Phycisphaerales bacterium]